MIRRRQHEDERARPRREEDPGSLARPRRDLAAWLAAEAAGDDDAAEAALGSLFAALPPVAPPRGLAERVLAETVWAVEPTAAEIARGWWRAAAVLAGLAAATVLAGGALAPSFVALLDPAAVVAGSVEGILAAVRAVGGWLGTAAHLADVLPWLGSATLLVVSSPEGVVALVAGAALVALAIKVLHQVLERDRRLSHAEAS